MVSVIQLIHLQSQELVKSGIFPSEVNVPEDMMEQLQRELKLDHEPTTMVSMGRNIKIKKGTGSLTVF